MPTEITTEELHAIVHGTAVEPMATYAKHVTRHGFTYPDLFETRASDGQRFFIKLRASNRYHVRDSLECLSGMNDGDGLIHPYRHVAEAGGYYLLVSDHLDGVQPIDRDRDQIPSLFGRLARFNRNNIVDGPYTSMYADGRYSGTISELVDSELEYHLHFFGLDTMKAACLEAIEPLKHGLGCIVNEDTNTGNMVLPKGATPVFIDTEWLHRGLNLHQFDHLDYFRFDEPAWYRITDEAPACYEAYFGELRLSRDEANDQIRAFETLRVLRKNTYWKNFKMEEEYPQVEMRVKTVLSHMHFV
jgi:hypothetical protein